VTPDNLRRGVGSALLLTGLNSLSKRGVKTAIAHFMVMNPIQTISITSMDSGLRGYTTTFLSEAPFQQNMLYALPMRYRFRVYMVPLSLISEILTFPGMYITRTAETIAKKRSTMKALYILVNRWSPSNKKMPVLAPIVFPTPHTIAFALVDFSLGTT